MGDQGVDNDQQNYEESYESDIQKKFERELQQMERSRQKDAYNNQQDQNGGYQNEQNQEDDQHNYKNEDDSEGYNQDQKEYNQEGNEGYYQDQHSNQEKNQQDQSLEHSDQYDNQQQIESQGQENTQNMGEDNQENYDKEEVSKKVETHQNDDGSVTTVTYTTVTKTKKIDLQDYSMPTIEEQDADKHTKYSKHGSNRSKNSSPKQNGNKNVFNQLDEDSQQKIIIKSLKEELKDEREINAIQALEIESLKQLVRRLQGNIETLQLQLKGEQNRQQTSSPYKTESSKRSEPIYNQVKIYQSMEVKNVKHSAANDDKTQNNENEGQDGSENRQQNEEKIHQTTFQKSLWIPQKEKMAEKQLYEAPLLEQEGKSKTLRPLKKITPKDKQQLQHSKNNKDQSSQSDVESKNKKKTDSSVFDEELSKIAKQNKEQFAVIYKQNKLKLRQEMFEDYQRRKQQLLEKRENRNKLDANWQESLHQVSRAKSVKNISVNVFNMSDKQPRYDLRTPSYMERQMQTIQKEIEIINSKSISNLPTLENGYSPNSISSIAAGRSQRKKMEVKSSISIPNISESPDNQFYKSQASKKKLFLYQIADADKNYLTKSHQYKHLKLSKEELKQQQENIENMKEKQKEEEQKKLDRYNQLKVSPEYCLMRKNSEELRSSQVQSAKSNQRKSQDQHPKSQVTISYPALSGLLSQHMNENQNNNQNKSQLQSSNISSKAQFQGNPYSIESNPQKEDGSPPTPKKKVKSQVLTNSITTTSIINSSIQNSAIKNPYVISSIQRVEQKSKVGNNNQNSSIWDEEQNQKQQKNTSQDNPNVKVTQNIYTTRSVTKQEKQEQNKYDKQKQNNSDEGQNNSNKGKNIDKQGQDKKNTDRNSQSDSNSNNNEKSNSSPQDDKNKQPVGNYKIQQHEYNELFQKGKLRNDQQKKSINWDDQVIENNDPKNKVNPFENNKNNQNKNQQQQQQQQQKQSQNQQNNQNRIQNTYFQQKYSNQQPNNQIQQQPRQGPQQGQNNQQYPKQQQEQQYKNNINQQQQQYQKTNNSSNNLNNSQSKSQISKNSQQNQESFRGSESNKSFSPKSNNQYQGNQQQQDFEPYYQDQQYYNQRKPSQQDSNEDDQSRDKNKNYSNTDNNKINGLGNLQGVQGKFTQFDAQGQLINQNQKPQIQKREPKVREQPPPPKKSEFVEQLEKEAQKESKVHVRDEKVFLKPIESDDEPMFGYDESEQEEEEEEKPQQNYQKRSSLRQSNQSSNHQKKRVSIHREEDNYEEEDEDQDETKYRKTPRTPFNQKDYDEEDQYN